MDVLYLVLGFVYLILTYLFAMGCLYLGERK